MVDNTTLIGYNLTIDIPRYRDDGIQYVTETHHAISFGEVAIVTMGFIFLAYWLIKVTRNKEYYMHWKNPNGREVNLYKVVRIMFYAYTATVIILGSAQIYLSSMVG